VGNSSSCPSYHSIKNTQNAFHVWINHVYSPSCGQFSYIIFQHVTIHYKKLVAEGIKKGRAIPVTGRGGPQSCKTSRLPYFLDNRLTDGDDVVSLTRRPPFTPQEDSWRSFLLDAESTPGP
jgi:hypothetical protein